MPAIGRLNAWLAVRDELSGVLSTIPHRQVVGAAALFTDRVRRWFCCGQDRSGLVAQIAAMRLTHVGFDAHADGEATAPAIGVGPRLRVTQARHTNLQSMSTPVRPGVNR